MKDTFSKAAHQLRLDEIKEVNVTSLEALEASLRFDLCVHRPEADKEKLTSFHFLTVEDIEKINKCLTYAYKKTMEKQMFPDGLLFVIGTSVGAYVTVLLGGFQ